MSRAQATRSRRDVMAMSLAACACGVASRRSGAAAPDRGLRARADVLPVRVDRGKSHLVDARGEPFLVHGDTAWSLIGDLTRENALHYIEDRHRRGFNALVVSVLEYRYSRNAPRNAYGHPPFAAGDQMVMPVEEYFRHVDWVIGECGARGMLLFLAPAYIGYKDADDGWYRTMVRTRAGPLRAYGRYLGQRYGSRRNIVWMHGGDANPPDRTLCAAIAEGIRDESPASLHTAHCAPETMAVEYWGDQSWLSLNTLYTYRPVHLQTARARAVRPGMPSILIESAYEDEAGTGVPAADAHRTRVQTYQAMLGGACGHVFGNNPIWHFDGPGLTPAPSGWKAALDSAGARSMQTFKQVMSTVPWWRLEPAPRLVTSGTGGDAERVVAAATSGTALAMIYGPVRRTIDIVARGLAGRALSAHWIDPATGAVDTSDVVAPASGRLNMTPPAGASHSSEDWILLLASGTDH